MRSMTMLAVPVLIGALPVGLSAQAQAHVGHVRDSFASAPDGAGLLPLALAEAEIAVRHAQLATEDVTYLEGMKSHAGHVLHALSPAEGAQGPGRGFGVKRAAEGVATHIGMAASSDGASQGVRTHAEHVAAAARTAARNADEAAAIVERIQAARTYSDAEPLVQQLLTVTRRIVSGYDANGDGRITWEEGEGGLEQAQQHLELLSRGS